MMHTETRREKHVWERDWEADTEEVDGENEGSPDGHKAASVLSPGSATADDSNEDDEASRADEHESGGRVRATAQEADVGVLGQQRPQPNAKNGSPWQLDTEKHLMREVHGNVFHKGFLETNRI